jgi:hypothetical protein
MGGDSMSSTWDEASKCPRDGGYTGIVVSRKPVRGGGQLVTLECPETNCEFNATGWIVQIRPDNTIPDKLDLSTRETQYKNTMTETQKQTVRDALARQVELEQKPGYEVRGY